MENDDILLNICTVKRTTYNLLFKINDYMLLSSDIPYDNYALKTDDEYIHTLKYRRLT